MALLYFSRIFLSLVRQQIVVEFFRSTHGTIGEREVQEISTRSSEVFCRIIPYRSVWWIGASYGGANLVVLS